MNYFKAASLINRHVDSFDPVAVHCVSTGPNEAGTHEACKYEIEIEDCKLYAVTIDGVIENATPNRRAADFFYGDAIKIVDAM